MNNGYVANNQMQLLVRLTLVVGGGRMEYVSAVELANQFGVALSRLALPGNSYATGLLAEDFQAAGISAEMVRTNTTVLNNLVP